MDAKLKAKWVEALRSGKYTQTSGFLNRQEPYQSNDGYVKLPGYCCLGVLCDITPGVEWDSSLGPDAFPVIGGKSIGSSGMPSEDFLREVGLIWKAQPGEEIRPDATDPEYTIHYLDFAEALASANDDGRAFTEIADWIEANL